MGNSQKQPITGSMKSDPKFFRKYHTTVREGEYTNVAIHTETLGTYMNPEFLQKIQSAYTEIIKTKFPGKKFSQMRSYSYFPKDYDFDLIITGSVLSQYDLGGKYKSSIKLLIVDYVDDICYHDNYIAISQEDFEKIINAYTIEKDNADFDKIREANHFVEALEKAENI